MMINLFKGNKFSSKATSMSLLVNETTEFRYPSVTLCAPFPGGFNLIDLIRQTANETGAETIDELDIQDMIDSRR